MSVPRLSHPFRVCSASVPRLSLLGSICSACSGFIYYLNPTTKKAIWGGLMLWVFIGKNAEQRGTRNRRGTETIVLSQPEYYLTDRTLSI